MNHRTSLLFLLALIIVALASVAGVYAFAQASAQNRRDSIVNRSVELAARSQHWAAKPSMFGGGGGQFDGLDIWKVTGQTGTGFWLEEEHTLYRIDPHERPGYGHVTALDKALGLRVVVVFSQNEVVNTVIEQLHDLSADANSIDLAAEQAP